MAPLLKHSQLSPKIAHVLELLQLIEEFEAKLHSLTVESVPDVDRELMRSFEEASQVPNPNPDWNRSASPDFDPVYQLTGKDVNRMSLGFEVGAERHLKKVKQLLMFDYRLLLKVLLVSSGVNSVVPRAPGTELDVKALQLLGIGLVDEGSDSDKEDEEKKKSAKRLKPRVSTLNKEAEEPASAFFKWLRGRGSKVGKHATDILDRTLALGAEFLLSQGFKKVYGGTMGPLVEERKQLQDALNGINSEKTNGEASAK